MGKEMVIVGYKNYLGVHDDLGRSSVFDHNVSFSGGSVLVGSADSVLFDCGLLDQDACLVGKREPILSGVESKRGKDSVDVIEVRTEDQHDRPFESRLGFSTTC